jgi:RHS repeat-associated protein
MLVPTRHSDTKDYRYGFQGQEKDDEIKGEGNSYDYGARLYEPRIGRWFSVDPVFVKYPYESNYVSFGNNPILFIDVDGRDIIVYLSNGKALNYTPGMKVPSDKFGKAVVQALNRVHSTGEGEIVVKALTNSNKTYHIKEAGNLFATTPREKEKKDNTAVYLGKNGEKDDLFNKAVNKGSYSNAEKIISGTQDVLIKVYFGNYDIAWKYEGKDPDGVKTNFELALGHELFHGYQFEIGSLNKNFTKAFNSKTGNVPILEAQAVGFENYLRASLFGGTEFGNTRAHYSGNKIDDYFKKPDGIFEEIWYTLSSPAKLDVIEFKKEGKAFSTWKNYFSDKLKTSKK